MFESIILFHFISFLSYFLSIPAIRTQNPLRSLREVQISKQPIKWTVSSFIVTSCSESKNEGLYLWSPHLLVL